MKQMWVNSRIKMNIKTIFKIKNFISQAYRHLCDFMKSRSDGAYTNAFMNGIFTDKITIIHYLLYNNILFFIQLSLSPVLENDDFVYCKR